jgi:hypothetical protein
MSRSVYITTYKRPGGKEKGEKEVLMQVSFYLKLISKVNLFLQIFHLCVTREESFRHTGSKQYSIWIPLFVSVVGGTTRKIVYSCK